MSQTMLKKRIKFLQNTKKSGQGSENASILQSASNQNSQNYFQSFIYNDHITNNKLYFQNGIFDRDKSQINNSYALMKSTKRFHLKSLKNKYYKFKNQKDHSLESFDRSNNSQRDRIKDYLMKRKIQREKYSEQKKQLSMLLSRDRGYLYSSAGVSVQKTPRESFKPKSTPKQQDIEFFQNFQQTMNEKESNKSKQNQLLNREEADEVLKELGKNFNNSEQLLQKFEQFLKQQKMNQIMNEKKGISKLVSETLDYQSLTKSQKQLVNRLDIQLRREVTKNSEYLIIPDLSKVKRLQKMRTTPGKKARMQNIINNPISQDNEDKDRKLTLNTQKVSMKKGSYRKISTKKNEIVKSQIEPEPQKQQIQKQKQNEISHYRFKIDQLKRLISTLSKKTQIPAPQSHTNTPFENILISQLKKGTYFKLEIELSSNPSYLHIKEEKTKNNLLHLCVLNNKPEIFKMVIMKCRQNNVNLLNQPNKFGKTPYHVSKEYKGFYQQVKQLEEFIYPFRWI